MNNFFGMLSRMKYINRWGLMRNNINENIAEHSLQVAIIAHGLAVIGNKRFGRNLNAEHIAMMGIMHDTTEIITGDLPTPIKYYAPEIRDAYKKVENIAANQLLKELPEDMQEAYENILIEDDSIERKYVEAADKLSAYIKCIEEKNTGNTDFAKAEDTIRKALEDMQMEEIDVFIEEFLPAYVNADQNSSVHRLASYFSTVSHAMSRIISFPILSADTIFVTDLPDCASHD